MWTEEKLSGKEQVWKVGKRGYPTDVSGGEWRLIEPPRQARPREPAFAARKAVVTIF